MDLIHGWKPTLSVGLDATSDHLNVSHRVGLEGPNKSVRFLR